jgi:benzoate-CoA ligase
MAVRYQNDLARSRETFVGTWCRTGDKFVQHGDQFQFCGRSKDMLKVNANWVSPVEIENILVSHKLVHEAGVSGISNKYGLTAIVAYIVVDPAAAIPDNLEHQLKSLVRRSIDHYKSPDQIRWVRQLPKNTNGKLQRYLLNDTYNDNKL